MGLSFGWSMETKKEVSLLEVIKSKTAKFNYSQMQFRDTYEIFEFIQVIICVEFRHRVTSIYFIF
jgi:hypothetical protein